MSYHPATKQYPDYGCNDAKKTGHNGGCLNCRFPDCIEGHLDNYILGMRNQQMRILHAQGHSVYTLSVMYNLSLREIQRILD